LCSLGYAPVKMLISFDQMRRNNDRKVACCLAQFPLVAVLLITAKLIDWRNRWSPDFPIRAVS
jgi:hypothetical protein